jgi:hypothetical protein
MSVVNCKVTNIRPKFKNLKDWMDDPDNIYIGRKGIVFIDKIRFPQKSSIWSNPYKIGKDGTRDEIIDKYKIYIENKILNEPNMIDELLNLKNKNLGCWCKPDKCHGDILLQLINKYHA